MVFSIKYYLGGQPRTVGRAERVACTKIRNSSHFSSENVGCTYMGERIIRELVRKSQEHGKEIEKSVLFNDTVNC
jgi:hypothetical protein